MELRKIVCAFVIMMMCLTCVDLVERVSATETSTVTYRLYPESSQIGNDVDYAVTTFDINGPVGSSVYMYWQPIYINNTAASVKSIMITAKVNRPVATTGNGYRQFVWRNEVTSTVYTVGPQYTDAAVQTTMYPTFSFLTNYNSGGAPMHFTFGCKIVKTNTVGGNFQGSIRCYYVDLTITYEFTESSGSSTTVLNAIAGMNASMQTRFNSVDNAISTVSSRVTYINNTLNTLKTNVAYMNNTVNNIDSNVDDIVDDITYMNSTIIGIDSKIDTALTNISYIRSELANLTGDISYINSTVDSINNNCINISGDISSLSTDISNVSAQVSGVSGQITNLFSNISNRFNISMSNTVSLFNTLSYQISITEGRVIRVAENVTDIENLLVENVTDIFDRFDSLDTDVSNIYSLVYDGFNSTFDEFVLTRDYINSTIVNITGQISNATTSIVDTVYGYVSDASNNTISNLTAYITNRTDAIMGAIGNISFNYSAIQFNYSIITDEINSSEAFVFAAINDVANATDSFLYTAMSDYYNSTISNVSVGFNDMLSEINSVYGATLNLTSWTLDGFNGTSEEFDYTWQLINETYDLVGLAYDEFDVVENMIDNSTEMVEYILTTSFDYRNDILENISVCCVQMNEYQNYLVYTLDNYYILIGNVETGVIDILASLNESKTVTDDGLLYVLYSADADVSVKYNFVKNKRLTDKDYYTYTVSSRDEEQLSRAEIVVDYNDKDLEGFWRDVVIVGVDGEVSRVIPLGNYYFDGDTLTIDTLNVAYDSFEIHVYPSVFKRLTLYWNNYWYFSWSVCI